MTHISRQFLKGEAEEKLIQELLRTLTTYGTPARRVRVAKELLTGVERLMLAKRLAIISLLGEGVSFEQISEQLKVSPSTPPRLWEHMQKGRFKTTIDSIRKNKVSSKILGFIEALLMPRSRVSPRWKFIDEF